MQRHRTLRSANLLCNYALCSTGIAVNTLISFDAKSLATHSTLLNVYLDCSSICHILRERSRSHELSADKLVLIFGSVRVTARGVHTPPIRNLSWKGPCSHRECPRPSTNPQTCLAQSCTLERANRDTRAELRDWQAPPRIQCCTVSEHEHGSKLVKAFPLTLPAHVVRDQFSTYRDKQDSCKAPLNKACLPPF